MSQFSETVPGKPVPRVCPVSAYSHYRKCSWMINYVFILIMREGT